MARDACDGPLQALLVAGSGGQAVLPAVWAACKEGVTRGLVLLYEQDPQNISRVLDVCQVSRAALICPHGQPCSTGSRYLHTAACLPAQPRFNARMCRYCQACLHFCRYHQDIVLPCHTMQSEALGC